MAENFTANVQYNDWKGTAAADDADSVSIQSYFRKKGVPENGFVVAIRAFYLSVDPGMISVSAIYADAEGYDNVDEQIKSADELSFKELEIDLPFAEFFGLFKRFSVVLPVKGLGLDGRDYTIQNS